MGLATRGSNPSEGKGFVSQKPVKTGPEACATRKMKKLKVKQNYTTVHNKHDCSGDTTT
jgi:hypothetical protein